MHDFQVKHESPAYTRSKCGNHGDDLDCKERTTDFRTSVDAFRRALPHLPRPGRVVEGDTPGYLFAPRGTGQLPAILHIGGYDSTAKWRCITTT